MDNDSTFEKIKKYISDIDDSVENKISALREVLKSLELSEEYKKFKEVYDDCEKKLWISNPSRFITIKDVNLNC
jgi:spore maturation protein CgeB